MRGLPSQLPLLLGCLLALSGCGLGAGPAPRAVSLLVTTGFGDRVLHEAGHPRTAGQETVMSLLLRNYAVSTRFGGGFVQAIDGLSGGQQGGAPIDWFYYVNGVQAAKGAAATNVHPGDHIWWDLHDWSQTEDVPAVVGSFPEPFLNGLDGKRLPVRVECAKADAPAAQSARGCRPRGFPPRRAHQPRRRPADASRAGRAVALRAGRPGRRRDRSGPPHQRRLRDLPPQRGQPHAARSERASRRARSAPRRA